MPRIVYFVSEAGPSDIRFVPSDYVLADGEIELDGDVLPDPSDLPGFLSSPEEPTQVDAWCLARFFVSAGRLTVASEAKNLAGVRRIAAGKARVSYVPTGETLMAFPIVIDPSNDRRAFPGARGPNYFDIHVVNSSGVLTDAAEVYVLLIRIVQP